MRAVSSVKCISKSAFNRCSSLTNVTIPDSVVSIGYAAFVWCSSLTSVTIPDSVTSIGYEVFYECTSLTDVCYGGSEDDWSAIERRTRQQKKPQIQEPRRGGAKCAVPAFLRDAPPYPVVCKISKTILHF
ncbi:MAG: leucine-rich repeat domain-containing protein [Oscillospiraceae bacterium]|nr:leucine-rich repeat domain-containing protein [Oscillospiraceae bacterium]